MATLAAMLGAKLPDNAGEDSWNLLRLWYDMEGLLPIREAIVHHAASGRFAIRRGDWVLIDGPTGDDNGRKGEPEWFKKDRDYQPHDEPGEIYKISDDRAQRQNVYADHPDIVRQLKSLLEKYKQHGRSTPGSPQKNDVERIGPRVAD
jgi:hypothetical protein